MPKSLTPPYCRHSKMKSLNVPRQNNTRIQKNRESKVRSGQIDRLGTSSVKGNRKCELQFWKNICLLVDNEMKDNVKFKQWNKNLSVSFTNSVIWCEMNESVSLSVLQLS